MPDIRLQDYVVKIKNMIQEDRHDEAIAHCQHILKHYPKHIQTYCLLGEACLEKEMFRESIEFFQRALGADPENFVARVGLGIIYGGQGSLPEAIWQLERAFELEPGNAEVRQELQRLYAQRDGKEKQRLKLTRGALGRLYARNGLYERAIAEFQNVLRQDPHLPDVRVALIEALWREGRRLEAVESCLELLDTLPNCLKANLVLAEVWLRGGHEDAGAERLKLAQALDPENLIAQEMMGRESPLPYKEVFLPELEYSPGMAFVAAPEAAALSVPITAEEDMEEQAAGESVALQEWGDTDEFPDWLRDMGMEGMAETAPEVPAEEGAASPAPPSGIPRSLQALVEAGILDEAELERALATMTPEELAAQKAEEMPPWLAELIAAEPVAPEEAPAEELTEKATAGEEAAEEVPAWLAELEGGEAVEEAAAEVAAGVEAAVEEVPAWLAELEGGEAVEEAAAEVAAEGEAAAEEVPAWLRALEAGEVEEVEAGEEEVPAWLTALGAAGAVARIVTADESPGEEPAEEVAAEEVAQEVEPPAETRTVVEADVPPSLQALVAAGLMDEADLKAAMSEMSAEELEKQRAEAVPGWLQELVGEESPAEPGPSLAATVVPGEVAATETGEPLPEEEAQEKVPLDEQPVAAAPVPPQAVEKEIPAQPPQLEKTETEALPAEAEVPESLQALVEAGLLDEADLREALTEMTPEELAAQRVEEVPDWLSSLIAEEEAAAAMGASAGEEARERLRGIEVEAQAPVEEAPPVEDVPAEEEAVPTWLRELESEVEAPAEEAPPVAEAPREEETIPAWLQGLESEAEAPAEELAGEAISEKEAAPTVEEAVPDWLPGPTVDWQPPLEEAPPQEVPTWVREIEAEAPEERPAQGEAAPPELAKVPAAEISAPSSEEGEMAPPEETAEPAEAAPPSRVDELLAQIQSRPRDYKTRLELARFYRRVGDWDASLGQYEKLINARKQLPVVIEDLRAMEGENLDRARLYQLLGDALMQEGQLDEALTMYRQARQALVQ